MKHIPSISENEWLLMDVIWQLQTATASDFVKGMEKVKDISARTVRVMISRLVKKGVLSYDVDEVNPTVFHYHANYTKEECLQAKSNDFKEAYFEGNSGLMLVTMVKQEKLSKKELNQLMKILEEYQEK